MKKIFFLLGICILLIGSSSCRKDNFSDAAIVKLTYSTDTVFFDTVFTSIGSVTKRLKIRNPLPDKILINKLFIQNGKNSRFRINVDGFQGDYHENLEIRGNDSMYVFVEVSVNPTDNTSPFIIEDAIIVETRGNKDEVKLVAWGQDAYFIRGSLITDEQATTLTFPNDKPIVFYGLNLIDSAKEVIIQEGSNLYFHSNAALVVYKEASLKILGTDDNQVTIQGDRLEPSYRDAPGQWDRIWFFATSKDNVIENTVIRNGNIGLQVDSVGDNNTTLRLKNVTIENMSGLALLAQGSSVLAENCLFVNCGRFAVALVIGGDYQFTHCTFANYWNYSTRTEPMLLINNYYEASEGQFVHRPLTKANFHNCIIHGSNKEEINLDTRDGSEFSYHFSHCILKTELPASTEGFDNNTYNPNNIVIEGISRNPIFNEISEADYTLFEQSVARNKGNINLTGNLLKDKAGVSRSNQPDLGAYEFVP